MSSEQTADDKGTLEFVPSDQSVWHPCTEVLDLNQLSEGDGRRCHKNILSAGPVL